MNDERSNVKSEKSKGQGEYFPEDSHAPKPENMETHAHHLHKAPSHGWKHYFFEFFMLFLAVTLGFLVENQREHYVDRKKESVYVRGIVKDLVSDTINFSQFINKTLENESRIDSLIDLLKVYKSASPTGELYYLARTAFGKIERLQYNRRTYDQLKSSGSLRLIHHQGVLDSISKYFESLQWIDLQNQLQIERQTIYAVQLGEIFDAWTIDSVFNTNFSKPNAAPSLLTTDKRDLNRFVMRLHILKGVVLFNLRRVVNDYLPNAKKLIALIKEEYSIDE